MATHSSVLAWRIPGMEEPGGLPSLVDRVGHNWSDLAAAALNLSSLIWVISKNVFVLFLLLEKICFSPINIVNCISIQDPVWLKINQYYWPFQWNSFCFIDFSYFSVLNFTYFCSKRHYFLLLLAFNVLFFLKLLNDRSNFCYRF